MLEESQIPQQEPLLLEQEFSTFKQNVDDWIKDFNGQMQSLILMADVVDENIDNTNHNYELLQHMRKEMEDLQQEVKSLKLMQLLVLKKTLSEKKM